MSLPVASPQLIVDTGAIAANWRTFAAACGPAATGAAIKADGYGLGGRVVLSALAGAGCRDMFVASWAEVAALGALPDGVRVAVLHGVTPGEMAAALVLPARPVLVTADQVAAWRQTRRPCDVMVDTGMNRLGLSPADALSGLLDGLDVETLHSQLACAETPAHSMNAAQLQEFAFIGGQVRARRLALANSAGIGLGAAYHFGLTRPGIGLYGGGEAPGGGRLTPVLAITAPILQVRGLVAGASVGYGANFVAQHPMRVAVVALGYADGYPRGASHAGWGQIDGKRVPAIGRVSMDLMTFDVTSVRCREGDRVEVEFDLPALAAASGRSQYELLTGLGRRYARSYR